MTALIKLNIGCGQTPTAGFVNYDNSLSVRLAKWPTACACLNALGLLRPAQVGFIKYAKRSHIRYADAAAKIPEATASVDLVYSSHMLEHLDRDEARRFLREVHRVLRSGGYIRLAVPNTAFHVRNYLAHGDCDRFMDEMAVCRSKEREAGGKIGVLARRIAAGVRHHKWMYDGPSLCRLLVECGFRDAVVVESGSTTLPDTGALNLSERAPESVFVEAIKPSG